ncbi:hypothetical protein BD626DRAFT_41413 [Schizophyllum amplum]|uniref:DUF1793-domain-containing protein n=1 Tax=Schizophyllum amplum TaxID=97359 RepID=A0A550CDG4_9AGAR|nr:hypothetical protein BD626DRAFT_41413 [Auriculariopsis ampla]
MRATLCCLAFGLLSTIVAQQSSSGFTPLWVPLAERTPHFNAWKRTNTATSWAVSPFSTMGHILAWAGYVAVDDVIYTFNGVVSEGNATTASQVWRVSPTRTIQTSQAGPVQITATWMSPIEPDDLVKQSMPFVYFSMKAVSTDGSSHSVQFYSDVSAEWLSHDLATIVEWDTTTTANSIYHKAIPQDPQPMVEESGLAQDGTLYYGVANSSAVTWQTGDAETIREQFYSTRNLKNSADTATRAIYYRWPVFALSWDMGDVSSDEDEAVFALGFARRPVIEYDAGDSTQERYPYFLTEYSNADDAFQAFIADYDDAVKRADALDSKIMDAAGYVSSDYADLVALGARQTLAGVEWTTNDNNDADDVLAFMRQSGDSQRVNAVETLYAAWPAFLYLNATWGQYLLEPLLKFESSTAYTKDYPVPDLGSSYPIADGNEAPAQFQAIEAAGDMLIMAYAQAQISGSRYLINRHYDSFKKWADYLVQNTQRPASSQKLPNDVNGGDNANVALKGIMGIRAMAGISDALDKSEDSVSYLSNASLYMSSWADKVAGGINSADGMIYNVFADKLLQTKFVPDAAYEAVSLSFSDASAHYGISFDGSSSTVRSDWMIFAAASAPNNSMRDSLLQTVWARTSNASLDGAFPSAYDQNSGMMQSGSASPAQGAMFALLALDLTTTGITVPASPSSSASAPSRDTATPVGVIAGSVVGGLAVLALGGALVWFALRRRSARQQSHALYSGTGYEAEPFDQYGGRQVGEHESLPVYLPGHRLASATKGNRQMQQLHGSALAHGSAGNGRPDGDGAALGPQSAPLQSRSKVARARLDAAQRQGSGPLADGSIRVGALGEDVSGASRGDVARAHNGRLPEHELREEIANMRREMEVLRMQQTDAPPPEYRDL